MYGYFSGDGTIGKSEIMATSVSKELIEGIKVVLLRFNIQSSVKPYKKLQEISIKNGYNAKLPYNLYINCEGKQIFRDTFNLTIKYKNEKLKSYNSTEKYGRLNMIPNVVLSNSTKNIKRNDLQKIKTSLSNVQDIKVIEDIENEEIWYDRIIKIEEFESEHPYVYDFTTDITKNFTDYYGSAFSNQVEAIAGGYETAEDVWLAFKKSEGHRTHLLGEHPFYLEQDEIGVGFYKEWYSPHVEYWVDYLTKGKSKDQTNPFKDKELPNKSTLTMTKEQN